MMNKKVINAIIFCISFALFFTVIIQYISSKNILKDNDYSTQYLASLRLQLDELEKERKELTQSLTSINQKLLEATESNKEIKEKNDVLQDELNMYKIMSGGYDVKGEGLIITVNESGSLEQYYTFQNSTGMILSLISNLNSAGAEAISINDQRYTSYTELVPVSNFFSINGKHVAAPFVIKVIGDQRTLESALNFPGGVVDTLKNRMGFTVEIEKDANVQISGNGKTKTFKYLKPVEQLVD